MPQTLGHPRSLAAGHRRRARGGDPVPTLALQLLLVAVDRGIAKRSDTRFGSPSPAANHSQGADPDQRDSCEEARMMGHEQPQDSGWLQSHSSPARPRKDLSHKVLQSPGVLSGKFSLQLVGAGKLAERGQRATGSQNRPAK